MEWLLLGGMIGFLLGALLMAVGRGVLIGQLSPRGGGQGAEAAGLASAGMAPRTPPGALPGAPEPAVVRCVVMKGGRSRTTRSGRIPALSFLSALLPSSIYLTRGIVALVESRLQSARAWGEGRICHDHRAARLRGDRHDWRPG